MKNHKLLLFIIFLFSISEIANKTKATAEENKMISNENDYVQDPIIYTDIPDPDVIRVGDTFYMTSTTMYFSPGCPIMKSKDLVNWQIVNYVYDVLEDTDEFNLANGKNAYGRGTWASSLRYNNGTFCVLFMSFTSGKSYIYRTTDIENGKWQRQTFSTIFYDSSLLFDDDGKVYVVSASDGKIYLTELTSDLTKIKSDGAKNKLIASTELTAGLKGEGAHVQKINGKYYIFIIAWPQNSMRTQYCFRSDKIEGPYEKKIVLQNEGAAQGCIVDSKDGAWYGFVFRDMGPVGRAPVLVPVSWQEDWPILGTNGKVPHKMQKPLGNLSKTSVVSSDEFDSEKIKLEYQWNHNPNNSSWSLTQRKGFLRLTNGIISKEFTQTRNMLTVRTCGYICSGVTKVDTSKMKDGDIAGLAALQAKYGYIAVKKEGSKKFIVNICCYESGSDTYTEKEENRIELSQDEIYLKEHFNFAQNKVSFSYSLDGKNFKPFGAQLSMVYSLKHFTGYRFALFNSATKAAGGYVDFDFLHIE